MNRFFVLFFIIAANIISTYTHASNKQVANDSAAFMQLLDVNTTITMAIFATLPTLSRACCPPHATDTPCISELITKFVPNERPTNGELILYYGVQRDLQKLHSAWGTFHYFYVQQPYYRSLSPDCLKDITLEKCKCPFNITPSGEYFTVTTYKNAAALTASTFKNNHECFSSFIAHYKTAADAEELTDDEMADATEQHLRHSLIKKTS